MLKEMNHTHIVLIPKTVSPSIVHQFRLISLSNVCYKIIAKILSNRLKLVMQKFISPYQTAFLLGKVIQGNTILVQDVFHVLKNSSREKRSYGYQDGYGEGF